jgi:hypothetical protein
LRIILKEEQSPPGPINGPMSYTTSTLTRPMRLNTVYDKAGDHPTPIGMLWIRIADIAEEMRRKRLKLNSTIRAGYPPPKWKMTAPVAVKTRRSVQMLTRIGHQKDLLEQVLTRVQS